MIVDLERYPVYKDSGLPWLGQVQAHWGIRRNGGLFQQRHDSGDNELPILEESLLGSVRENLQPPFHQQTNKPPSPASSPGPPTAWTAPSAPSAASSPCCRSRNRPSSIAP